MPSAMLTRTATHAGSWYTGNGSRLDRELSGWLERAHSTSVPNEPEETVQTPVKGCKAIIAPHAGYSYSGPAAAWAYKCIDTTGIKRVFILGPAHHVYMDGCALSQCEAYETPIGDLPLDRETIKELRATGQFQEMDIGTDEDEHSIEMHLPYVRKVFEGQDIVIVPILVGAINQEKEAHFGKLLAPYLSREDTFCVVSSDFCHWGTRFSYTFYYPSPPNSTTTPPTSIKLSRSNQSSYLSPTFPIHASITTLDHEAMDILSIPPNQADEVHDAFAAYLSRTKNTICGRHPIGVLLGALAEVTRSKSGSGDELKLRWVRYEQSSQCFNIADSSVSYASAYVVF